MNYEIIHNKFINYFKSTNVRDRLLKRNPFDPRLNHDLYTEMHHIVPRSQGGKNDRDNLVKLLPEDHLFIHFLRFKAFRLSSDLKAVKMSLNGFNNKKIFKSDDYIKLNKHIRIIYAFARSAYKEKRKGKWISDKGLDSISKSSRGKIVVKNTETGEIVGKVDRDHKNIKNGLWVHHTKGFVTVFDENNKKIRISVEERRKNKEKYKNIFNMKGSKNSNYSGISDDMIIRYTKDFCGIYGAYPSYKLLRIFCNSKNINLPIILTRNFRFVENGGGLVGYNNIVSALGEVITYHGTRDKYKIIKNNILEKRCYDKNN